MFSPLKPQTGSSSSRHPGALQDGVAGKQVLSPCSRVHRLVFLPLYAFTALLPTFYIFTAPLPASPTPYLPPIQPLPSYLPHLSPTCLLYHLRPPTCLTYPLPASYTTSALLPTSSIHPSAFWNTTLVLPTLFTLPRTSYTSAVLFPTTSAPSFSVLATSSYLPPPCLSPTSHPSALLPS
ncbi:hypothetical protein Pcinc_044109 [Petrolisthes cinctipes]|uniref:Uncharacterized protein n=1 Tax=Petrolisthes cinctipes TaxID=88211 RepID=A0AAE1BEG0_PETCI|nr:hypothetical protein Pcinc_044109 [Petrolisthes cinctipes]